MEQFFKAANQVAAINGSRNPIGTCVCTSSDKFPTVFAVLLSAVDFVLQRMGEIYVVNIQELDNSTITINKNDLHCLPCPVIPYRKRGRRELDRNEEEKFTTKAPVTA